MRYVQPNLRQEGSSYTSQKKLYSVCVQLIVPEVFRMKYAWQFEGWFAAKERKKSLLEAERRSKRSGQPLRAPVLPADLTGYASTWEEDDTEAHAEERPFAALLADENAASDPLIASALSAAREAASQRGSLFPEPAYEADGSPISDVRDRVDRMASSAGIQVSETRRFTLIS